MKKLLIGVLGFALLTGCASVEMKETAVVKTAPADKAVVNFVRNAILLGDGIPVDLWDGSTYIGSLGAGTLVQYQVPAGKRLFLANAENWSYATAELEAGKQYYIKANFFPGLMFGRVALANVDRTDARIAEWMTYKNMSASEDARNEAGAKKQTEVRAAIADFESGKVTAFATLRPQDGR